MFQAVRNDVDCTAKAAFLQYVIRRMHWHISIHVTIFFPNAMCAAESRPVTVLLDDMHR